MINRIAASVIALVVSGCTGGAVTDSSSSQYSSEAQSSEAGGVSSISSSSVTSLPVSSSSSASSETSIGGNYSLGEQIYAEQCFGCHGDDGKGFNQDLTAMSRADYPSFAALVSYHEADMPLGKPQDCVQDCALHVSRFVVDKFQGINWDQTTSSAAQSSLPQSSSSQVSSMPPAVVAVSIPARIESEDVVRFYDTTSDNKGSCGDQSGALDLQPKTGGAGECDVNWTDAGEWLEYVVDVAEEGVFDITVSLAATNANKTVSVSIDGQTIGRLTAPTNGWTAFAPQRLTAVAIDQGQHDVRITLETGALNIDYIEFSESSGGAVIVGNYDRGEDLYHNDNALACAGCHGGMGEGLVGANSKIYADRNSFIVNGQAVNLAEYLRLEMPLNKGQLCGAQCSADLAVYILAQNWNAGDTGEGEGELVCDNGDPNVHPNSPLRMLTRHQLSHVLTDTFAPLNINPNNIAKDLSEDIALAGFTTNFGAGADLAQVSALDKWAMTIGERAANNFGLLMACDKNNNGCLERYAQKYGRLLFRRSLTSDEAATYRTISAEAGAGNTGVEAVTLAMVLSPHTLYEMHDEVRTRTRLTGVQIASKLAFLIWDRAPDDALIALAEQANALSTQAKIVAQAQVMLNDPRAKNGVAFFYENWLELNAQGSHEVTTATVTLDSLKGECASTPQCQETYAEADDCSVNNHGGVCFCQGEACGLRDAGGHSEQGVAFDVAKQEIDRFTSYLTLENNGTLSDIFESTTSVLDAELAAAYGVSTQGAPQYDGAFVVNLNAQERAGIATRIAVMQAGAHGDISPITGRGNKMRSSLLCDPPPEPPADVTDAFPTLPPDYDKTLRQKLEEVHLQVGGSCQGCHELMDPIGFLFENYDNDGLYRTEYHLVDGEGDGPDIFLPVDPSGYVLPAKKALDLPRDYDNAVAFSQALAKSDVAAQCYSNTWFERAYGRTLSDADICSADALFAEFKNSNYNLKEMILAIVSNSNFSFRNPE